MTIKLKLLPIALSMAVISLAGCSSGGSQTASSSASIPTSSGSTTSAHQHTFSDKWISDETMHWHPSTCGHLVKSDEGPHTFGEWQETTAPESEKDGEYTRKCTVCEYVDHKRIPQTGTPEKLEFIKSADETYYSVKAKGVNEEERGKIEGRVIIPEVYEGLPVKELYVTTEEDGSKTGAFEDCSNIDYVYVPDTITELSKYSFYCCKGLKEVSLPNTLKTIGRNAFYSCEQLDDVKIPNGVTTIEHSAFDSCEKLSSIKIPNSVTYLGSSAFEDCYALTSIVLPNNIKVIPEALFLDCNNLKSVVIPEGVTEIGDYVFYGCGELESVNLPSTIERIGNNAFLDCYKLGTNLNKYEDGLYIGKGDNPYYALFTMTDGSKTTYTIHQDCKYILEDAFHNCDNIETITVPKGVISIKGGAFSGYNIQHFYLENGSELQEFGYEVFNAFYNKLVYNEVNNGRYLGSQENPCMISMGLADDYEGTSFAIDNRCKFIYNNAFEWCTKLTSITVPDSVTSIDRKAFYGCNELTDITLGSGFDAIQYNTFEYCTSLPSIVIPEGVKYLESDAFIECSNLTTVTLPKSIEVIDYEPFDECVSLTTINYVGTKAEWEKVDRPESYEWGSNILATVVHCSDGDVDL